MFHFKIFKQIRGTLAEVLFPFPFLSFQAIYNIDNFTQFEKCQMHNLDEKFIINNYITGYMKTFKQIVMDHGLCSFVIVTSKPIVDR